MQSQAFLTYTRIDDEFFGGSITALRQLLELGVKVVTGDHNFKIFQDVDGIELGQQWQRRLDEAIATSSFLIPVLTPSFFRSEACRDELQKFLAREQTLRRDDLILPIYFVTVPSLEKRDQGTPDALAVEMNRRQRFDWRSQADLPLSEVQVRRAARALCEKIGQAIQRQPLGGAEEALRDEAIVRHSHDDGGRRMPPHDDCDADDRRDFLPASRGEPSMLLRTAEKAARNSRLSHAADSVQKILWVDDLPDNNIFERRALAEYGVVCNLARSTGEALLALRADRYDAIISDMGRPPDARAGYTLLRMVRETGSALPFFIYSNSRDQRHIAEALRRGAQGATNQAAELIEQVLKAVAQRAG